MFLVKSFIFKCGLAYRHPAVCALLNSVQPPARYTKLKSLASRYISVLQARKAADLTSFTLANRPHVPNELPKAVPSKTLIRASSPPFKALAKISSASSARLGWRPRAPPGLSQIGPGAPAHGTFGHCLP